MKNLSREAIKRMTGAQGSTTTIGGSGGGDMAGYATQLWTDENYVGKEFFRSLFKAYDANGNEVLPNDTNTQIDNIKAMFGFWTEFYISALGTGGQSTVGLRLSQLADVNVTGVQNDQVLKYDATSQKWVPGTASSGTDMATVWTNLAASGNQQINYSHLSGAISLSQGTITIGSSSITPLTQSTADDRYLKLSGGVISGLLSVNYTSGSSTRWTGIEVTSPADESSIGFGIDNDGRTVFGRYKGRGFIWNSNGSEVMTFLDGGNVGVGTSSPSYKLHVNGTFRANTSASIADIDIGYSNEINNTNSILFLQYRGSNGIVLCNNGANTHIGGLLSIVAGQRIYPNEGDLYIGNGSNAGWLMLQDVCSQASRGDGNWSIRTNGNAVFANVQSNGYVTALSDERKKDVVGEVDLTVEQIAKARTVLFRWKDKRDNDLHMGCIAQDWQVLTPQLVHDRNDELSMEYSVIAAIGTIKNSQRLVNHETRLRRLEKMFALNENDLED